MTKKLDPEIKALRAVHRVLLPLNPAARRRIAQWLASREKA